MAPQFVTPYRKANKNDMRDRALSGTNTRIPILPQIDHTPGVSVGQLRQDTQCYAPRLQVRAACCWQTWLHEVMPP